MYSLKSRNVLLGYVYPHLVTPGTELPLARILLGILDAHFLHFLQAVQINTVHKPAKLFNVYF